MRLIDPNYPDEENGKLWTIAKQVYQIYKDYDNDKSNPSLFSVTRLHLIRMRRKMMKKPAMCSKNVYDDLKIKFVELGIPENEIAFIHDYDTELKSRIFFGKDE